MAQIDYPQLQQLGGVPGGPNNGEKVVNSQSRDIFPPESPKDKVMDNAADTQGVPPKTDNDEHQKKPNDSGVHDGRDGEEATRKSKKRSEKHTKKQRAVVNRVLNCPDLDFYKVLDLEESAKTEEIRRAFKELSILTHPDKSEVPDTTKAFQRISEACQILSQRATRREYDQNRSNYKRSGKLEDAKTYFGEEFADNAWSTDDDDDDDDDEEDDGGNQDEDNDTAPKKPDDFRLAIYRQATEFVNSFLDGDRASGKKIEEFNRQIDAQNKKDGITGKEEYFIQDRVFAGLRDHLKAALGHYQANPDEEQPVRTIVELEKQMERTKRINSYPDDWILPIPDGLREKMRNMTEKQAEEKAAWQSKFSGSSAASSPPLPKEKDKGRAPRPSRGSAGESSSSANRASQSNQQSGSSKDKGKGRAQDTFNHGHGESSNTSKNQGKGREANSSSGQGSSKTVSAWRPGLTEQGEKILGMAPFEVDALGGVKSMLRCKFVVEKEGRINPIDFADDVDLGERATRGYLYEIPKSEQVDIRTKMNSYSRRDRANFDKILGVTPVSSDSSKIHPPIAIWARWKDASKKLMNRTGFTQIWGSRADGKIEDFFLEIGEEIPWKKVAKRPGHAKSIEYYDTHNIRAEPHRIRERSRHRETARSTYDPHRRRSLSRSSSGSLSDDGFRRLDAMESRQKVINKRLEEIRLDYESSNANLGMKIDTLASQMERTMAAQMERMMSLLSMGR
ncbi:Chaperone protein dnaJ [Cladophialophora chaetospira]|uniref:Chaperone protein dnaJ n=1 Tax=Cladophialophora chaetospira TaxID=386627 RepID=A0AA38WVN8_9EURO|nr:Chaperone protein dnaJ [Cladophialophora chaetospira]